MRALCNPGFLQRAVRTQDDSEGYLDTDRRRAVRRTDGGEHLGKSTTLECQCRDSGHDAAGPDRWGVRHAFSKRTFQTGARRSPVVCANITRVRIRPEALASTVECDFTRVRPPRALPEGAGAHDRAALETTTRVRNKNCR